MVKRMTEIHEVLVNLKLEMLNSKLEMLNLKLEMFEVGLDFPNLSNHKNEGLILLRYPPWN